MKTGQFGKRLPFSRRPVETGEDDLRQRVFQSFSFLSRLFPHPLEDRLVQNNRRPFHNPSIFLKHIYVNALFNGEDFSGYFDGLLILRGF